MFQLICLSLVQLFTEDANRVGHHCFYCISHLLGVMMKTVAGFLEERDVKMSKLEQKLKATDFSQNKSPSPLGVFPACAAATFVCLSSWKWLRSEIFNSLTPQFLTIDSSVFVDHPGGLSGLQL